MKRCVICEVFKPHTEFYKRHAKCKECHKLTTREWHASNPEKNAIYCRRYQMKYR